MNTGCSVYTIIHVRTLLFLKQTHRLNKCKNAVAWELGPCNIKAHGFRTNYTANWIHSIRGVLPAIAEHGAFHQHVYDANTFLFNYFILTEICYLNISTFSFKLL